MSNESKHVVIGTIGSDAHMIGAWVLQKGLSAAGFGVTSRRSRTTRNSSTPRSRQMPMRYWSHPYMAWG